MPQAIDIDAIDPALKRGRESSKDKGFLRYGHVGFAKVAFVANNARRPSGSSLNFE